jgi:hypothetical protein
MQSSGKLRIALALIAVLALLVAAGASSSGVLASPGTPSVQTTCVDSPSATGTTTVNLPITIQGLSDLGAAAYTLYLETPSPVTMPVGSNAGPEFTAWCTGIGGIPQVARTDVADDANCGSPHVAGTNCWQIDVFCFALGGLSGGVQPSLTSQLAVGAPLGSHNFTIIPELVNGSRSLVFDNTGVSAPMSPIVNAIPTVVIGDTCEPTAVTMAGFDTTTDSPAPFAATAWPLLAGAAALAAGGAYVLLRRKS